MKRHEKVTLGLFLLFFIIQLIPYSEKKGIFIFTTIPLFISYIVCGIQHYKSETSKNKYLFLIAGLGFALAIITIPLTIRVNQRLILQILPILNLLVLVYLIIIFIKFRKVPEKRIIYNNIIIRSLCIALITSFFSYTPIDVWIYRKTLLALNAGDAPLVANIKMFDYKIISEEAYDNGDCDKAIEYAIKSNDNGKFWILSREGLDTISPDISKKELQDVYYNISGTFTNLYRAYRCKGDNLYNEGKYEEAISYYKTAHQNLKAFTIKNLYWKQEITYALNNLGASYLRLNKFEYADSLFIKAIENHYQTNSEPTIYFANVYENLARSYRLQGYPNDSNILLKEAISIRSKDSIDNENTNTLASNYINLTENYLKMDSIPQAIEAIQKGLAIVDTATINYGLANLYYGIVLHKQSKFQDAETVVKKSLESIQTKLPITHQNIAESLYVLGITETSLAKYSDAKTHLEKGLEITNNNYSNKSVKYAHYLISLAFLHKITGNYNLAYEYYDKAYDIFQKNNELVTDENLISLLSEFALLKAELSETDNALNFTDKALVIITDNLAINSFNQSFRNLYNNSAYVYYTTGNSTKADSLYQLTLDISKKNNTTHDNPVAVALNGLGLLAIDNSNYSKADSLLTQAISLHTNIFTENHPNTATVYYNYSLLQLRQGNYNKAKSYLEKANHIYQMFFTDDHDAFANIYVVYGDIASKQKEKMKAREYYDKALTIYRGKFKDSHFRIVETKQKLNRIL